MTAHISLLALTVHILLSWGKGDTAAHFTTTEASCNKAARTFGQCRGPFHLLRPATGIDEMLLPSLLANCGRLGGPLLLHEFGVRFDRATCDNGGSQPKTPAMSKVTAV